MFDDAADKAIDHGIVDAVEPFAWQRVCRRLRTELGEGVFGSWFTRLELTRIEQKHRLSHGANKISPVLAGVPLS